MRKITGLEGKRFGKLKVISEAGRNKNGHILWKCICDCGNIAALCGSSLQNGNTRSCGCLHKEIAKKQLTTHGMARTPAYNTWERMLSRCRNKRAEGYIYYGARGITVCERWLKFENFFADMGERPKNLSIERINNDGNYEPENCKWATSTEQSRNQRLQKNNKTGVKGVYWDTKSRKYRACIGAGGKLINLGSFSNLTEATRKREEGEKQYWGNTKDTGNKELHK